MMRQLLLVAATLAFACAASRADPAAPASEAAPAGPANQRQPSLADPEKSPSALLPKSEVTGKTPADVVAAAPLATINNPYTGQADKIEAGKAVFQGMGCPGCHGGNGGGGMCPPLTNETWVYGSDDDTLFRLITLGSDGLQKKGFIRVGMENIVGPMPPFGQLIQSDEQLFELLAYLRTLYRGSQKRVNW
ncbi:cytochrome c class I [Methylocella silvestris BL2]|uniref:Cytochrome c class I n=1 Tax=Methylocella silvestris (strain DSM 15510 / CIP 108128 / LMG 27833 / NCIMB 13906 / BL2) TaxID=395965 RepID=B8EMC8_METSB|nr:c-type cytochrome [Methylocella silvestris]ACK52056.1 cytochrome c class I [Methylocella silvestris BL2]